jgi:dTMP kinase
MKRDYSGYLISIEGDEGCGKTSQLKRLVEDLQSRGLSVFPTREPGGTAIGEQIRDVLHSLDNARMHPRTETLLYQAARAQIVEEVLKPRLRSGEIVIADRFFDSTIAYQGYGHLQDKGQIGDLIKYATGGLTPDLTVLLDVEPEVGLSRKRLTDEWNRMDNLSLEFHRRVRAGYLEMASSEPARWLVVDANQGYDEVYTDLKKSVEARLTFAGLLEGGRRGVER